ncbi:SRPBCC family protein [Ferruginibacter sp.]
MADILHSFVIKAPLKNVFKNISTAKGLNQWWTLDAKGKPELNEMFTLNFGPGYVWEAVVSKCIANKALEFQLTDADDDWIDTKVGFVLDDKKGSTQVHFYHKGWPANNEHYRISSYCWAMYLRILKRYVESGEEVPYEKRLDV